MTKGASHRLVRSPLRRVVGGGEHADDSPARYLHPVRDSPLSAEVDSFRRMRDQDLWTVEYEGELFERFFHGLPEYEQAALAAAITEVLQVRGIDVCAGEWGKPLGGGLYEFRIRRSLQAILKEAGSSIPDDLAGIDRQVLLRVFCTFYGQRVVLSYSGYDKRKDPSRKRQDREVARARKIHRRWKRS